MHDVGKMGVPDATLLKPERLSSAEHEHVQLHAALGAQIAAEVLAADQVAWVRSHHERHRRHRVSRPPRGRCDPARRPHHRGRRRLGRDDRRAGRTRAALDNEDALAECLRVVGTQLDVKVVDALVRVLQARHRDERDIA